MSKNHIKYKRADSLTENHKILQLFLGLKQLSLAILLLGLGLLLVLYFAHFSKLFELLLILFFSFTSMGFIIARTRSIFSSYFSTTDTKIKGKRHKERLK